MAKKEALTNDLIMSKIVTERDQYQQATLEERNTINEIYHAYLGTIDDARDKSKSQEKIMKLRTEVSYIIPSIFSGNPEIEVSPIGEEDKDIAFVAEKIINHRFQTIPQAYEKIEAWVKQSVVFGTSILNVVWNFEMKENEDGMTSSPIKDDPDFQVPNILDCFYNPIIPDVECQNSIIFRSVVPVSEVKENVAYNIKSPTGGFNRDMVKGKDSSTNSQYDSSRQMTADKINTQQASIGTVEIYDRISEDRIQTFAEGKERLLLRDVANPYGMNSVKLTHEPNAIPNRFNGFGVGHNTLGFSKLIQKLSNRLQDAVNLGNNPHFLGRKGAGIDKQQLVVRSGGLTEVDTEGSLNDSIVPLVVPDIKNGALALLNRFDDEHKRASGANDLLQGSASNKTLGQDQIANTYSSSRFELINRRFKFALADVGRLLFKMEVANIQSIDAPILKIFPLEAEVQGGKIQYSRETVYQMLIAARDNDDLDLNIRVKGETNVAKNKDIIIKQLTELYAQFGPVLPPQNQMAWARKILELRGIEGIDDLVPSAEDMQAQQVPQSGMPQDPNMQPQGMYGQ